MPLRWVTSDHLVRAGLALSVIVVAARMAVLGSWWAGELVTFIAVGATDVVVTAGDEDLNQSHGETHMLPFLGHVDPSLALV